ncbi:MAG: hypothetical protein IPO21_15255 [Bacteroidales bacterium]|nr:hypothetical protein [Bacteroidales bacterium]
MPLYNIASRFSVTLRLTSTQRCVAPRRNVTSRYNATHYTTPKPIETRYEESEIIFHICAFIRGLDMYVSVVRIRSYLCLRYGRIYDTTTPQIAQTCNPYLLKSTSLTSKSPSYKLEPAYYKFEIALNSKH